MGLFLHALIPNYVMCDGVATVLTLLLQMKTISYTKSTQGVCAISHNLWKDKVAP